MKQKRENDQRGDTAEIREEKGAKATIGVGGGAIACGWWCLQRMVYVRWFSHLYLFMSFFGHQVFVNLSMVILNAIW